MDVDLNRRHFIAAGGTISLAGCYGLNRVLTTDDESETESTTTEDQASDPDIDSDQAGSTDEPPEERDETTPENQSQGDGNDTQDNESPSDSESDSDSNSESESESESEPDTPAIEVVNIVADQTQAHYEPAAEPEYDTDELFVVFTVENTGDRPVVDVRVDAWCYASDDSELGHEWLEIARLFPGSPQSYELVFTDVEHPERAVDGGEFTVEVTAASYS